MRSSDDCDVDRAQQQKCSSYRNLSLLGTGSFSEVFKVRDCETLQIYALKRSKKEMKTQKTVNDALNEVQIMEKLNKLCKKWMSKEEQNRDDDEKELMTDVNIALFHNHWFSSDGRLFQLFEFCEHGTLRQLIDDSEKQFTHLQSLQCVRQICCGLEIVHSAQVIHLDLKPENVLIDSNRVLKICDFGISMDCEDVEERKFEFSGDPTYIAPEVLQSLNHELTDDICDRTDIFSLGVMFLEMRCGIQLNKMKNKYERLRQLRSDEVDFEGILTDKVRSLYGKGAKLEVEEEHAAVSAVSDIESLCRRMLCNASLLRPTASAVRAEIDRVVTDHELAENMDGIRMLFERDEHTPIPEAAEAHTPSPKGTPATFMTPATAPAATNRTLQLQHQQRLQNDQDVFAVQPLRNFTDLESFNKGANLSKLRAPNDREKTRSLSKSMRSPMTPTAPLNFGINASFSPSECRNRGHRVSMSSMSALSANQSPARVDRSRSFMTPHRKPSKMEPFQMSALFSPSSPAKAMFSPSSSNETPLRVKPRSLSFGSPSSPANAMFSPSSSNETPLRVKPRSLSFGLSPMSRKRRESYSDERDSDDFAKSKEDLRPSKELSFLDQIANAGDNSSDDMRSDDIDADLELKQNEIVTSTPSWSSRFENPSEDNDDVALGITVGSLAGSVVGSDTEMSVNLEPNENRNENVVSAQQSEILLTAAMALPETPDVYFGRLSRILAESPQSSQHPLTPILERAVTGDQNAQMALLRALIERQQNMVSNGNEAETVDRLWADVYRLDREMVGAGNDPMLTYRLLLEQIAVHSQHARASILSTPPRRPRRPQCSQSADRSMFLNTPSPVARPRGSQSTDRVRRFSRQTMRQVMQVEVEDIDVSEEEQDDDDDEHADKTAIHSSADLFLID